MLLGLPKVVRNPISRGVVISLVIGSVVSCEKVLRNLFTSSRRCAILDGRSERDAFTDLTTIYMVEYRNLDHRVSIY